MKEDAPEDLACFPLLQEENEEECTSSFLVGDLQITAKFVGLFMDEDIYFGSDPKYDYKSELQSPQELHTQEESKTTLLGCEAEILVEEHATIVSVQEEDKVKNMCDEGYDLVMFIYIPLNNGKTKILHLHLRTARGRPIVREINSLLVSLLWITQSVQIRVRDSMEIRW